LTCSSTGAGRPPLLASASPLPRRQSDVSLQALRESNRRKGADSGVAFPPAMLDGVKFATTIQDGEEEVVFLVLVSKRLLLRPGVGVADYSGAVNVKWSTKELDLANELAMYHFRELWSKICDDALTGGYSSWERIVKGGQRSPGLCWDLNDDVCLSLYGSVGEAGGVTVWVERQPLVRSCA